MAMADDAHQVAGSAALTLSELLGLLSRRGTILVGISAGGPVEVWLQRRDGAASLGVVDQAIVEEAFQRGWVEGCAQAGRPTVAGCWQINAAGRAALRKLKSASDEAMTAEQHSATPPVSLSNCMPSFAVAESPLAWLRRRKDKSGQPLINAPQFDAGERLRADLWFGDMTPRVTVNWSTSGASSAHHGSGMGVDLLDRTVAAQQRVRLALAAAGPEFAGVLIDVCGHLKGLEDIELARGWPPRSAKIVLQLGLNALARHYGLITSTEGAATGGLRHWGSADYRPHGGAG